MKHILIVMVFMCLLSPFPLAAQDEIELSQTFENNEISFNYPDGWFIQDTDSGVFISNQELPADLDAGEIFFAFTPQPDTVIISLSVITDQDLKGEVIDFDYFMGFTAGSITSTYTMLYSFSGGGSVTNEGYERIEDDEVSGGYVSFNTDTANLILAGIEHEDFSSFAYALTPLELNEQWFTTALAILESVEPAE